MGLSHFRLTAENNGDVLLMRVTKT